MRVDKIITTNSPLLGTCKRCNSEMASVYEVPGKKLKVRCISCGTVDGDHPTQNVYFNCPACSTPKLNLGSGICEGCGAEREIDFLRHAKVTHVDPERVYKATKRI